MYDRCNPPSFNSRRNGRRLGRPSSLFDVGGVGPIGPGLSWYICVRPKVVWIWTRTNGTKTVAAINAPLMRVRVGIHACIYLARTSAATPGRTEIDVGSADSADSSGRPCNSSGMPMSLCVFRENWGESSESEREVGMLRDRRRLSQWIYRRK